MKYKINYLGKFYLLILLVLNIPKNVYSQTTEIIQREKPGLYIEVGLGPIQSSIRNAGSYSVTSLNSNNQNSYFGSLGVGYFFSNYIGLLTGLNYVSYKSRLSLNTYQMNFDTIDSESDPYEMRVFGKGIQEKQTIDVLNIPLCLNIRVPFSKTVGMFLKGGVNLSFLLNQKYESSGTFTYKGFYPQYNDLLENLPTYGFPTDKSIDTEGELKLKSMGISPCISSGIDFYVRERIQIVFGFSYNNMSLKVKDRSTSIDKFQLSPDADHINSFIGGCNKISAQSMGVEFTFRYYLK